MKILEWEDLDFPARVALKAKSEKTFLNFTRLWFELLGGQLRTIQRNHETFDLIASKGASYKNCLITNTRTEVDVETEGGLIIVVDMLQLMIIHDTVQETNANLPWADSVATQGQAEFSGGEVITEVVEVA